MLLNVAAHAGAAVALALLVLGFIRLKQEEPDASDEWRDRPPTLFRLARPLVNLFAHRIESSMTPQLRNLLNTRLSMAGLTYSVRAEEFLVAQRIGLVIGLGMFVYAYVTLDLKHGALLYLFMLSAPLGYLFPRIWLRDTIARRQRTLEKEFPFFLDILVLSMRAGLNFSGAIAQSVSKMPQGPVKDEFSRLLREIRTGTSRREALRGLAARSNLPAIANFCAAINQAEETGGEIGGALIAQASQRRAERFLKAEKLANQAPMKLLLPLVALLFPISLIIILFPLVIRARDSGALQMLWN